MSSNTGVSLLQQGLVEFQLRGNPRSALNYYTLCINRIIQHEYPTARLSARATTILTQPSAQDEYIPEQVLGVAWASFLAILKDRSLGISTVEFPEAGRLLELFKPEKGPETNGLRGQKKSKGNGKKNKVEFRRFEMTDTGKLLLKGMQITAGITLGILAWDAQDRATAAKRYAEAFALAATHTPYDSDPSLARTGLEKYVANEVKTARENYATLRENDVVKASVVGREGDAGRRERLEVPNLRMEGDGRVVLREEFEVATDECAGCRKREVKMKQCNKCHKVLCRCFCFYFLSFGCCVELGFTIGRLWR